MELINKSRLVAGCSVGLEPSGRELLVVVVKGTFGLPRTGEPPRLLEQQVPLVAADVFSGEPGKTAVVHEVDFAPRKQRCDVLVAGSARAPAGRAVRRMRVRLKIGPINKEADVVGDRKWQIGLGGINASEPEPFETMPLSYDRAFGGSGRTTGNEDTDRDAYLPNPVGRGWYKKFPDTWVERPLLPNLEVPGKPVCAPSERYTPIAFGPVGRGWPQRARHAGTYDQHWLDNVFPFLPDDFDERYYQAAPEDQQMPIPTRPVHVLLDGLTDDGRRAFTLPYVEAPVAVFPKRGGREAWVGVLDTIVFEPDFERVALTWRVTRPLKKNVFEIAGIQVGFVGHESWDTAASLRTGVV